jgi:hypothetical protein
VEFYHRVCSAWDTLESLTVEWGNGSINEPDVELDRLQCELLRRLFWNGVESTPGDHNHRRDVFAFEPG